MTSIDLPEELDEEFHRLDDEEHIPERLAVPGITRTTRWQRQSGDWTRFVAVFDADGEDALRGGPYAELKSRGDNAWTGRMRSHFTTVLRVVFEERTLLGNDEIARCAVSALTQVPRDLVQCYRRWYDEEHGPAVSAVPGVACARRLERVDGEQPTHLTILGLGYPTALEGPEFAAAKARSTDSELRGAWRRVQRHDERIRRHP